MKKVIFVLTIAVLLIACKKTKFEPEGPTDVRIRNLSSDYTFTNVIVATAGGRDTTGNIKKLGDVSPGLYSGYKRFAIAFSRAEISASINGNIFSTGPINSTYWNYEGQMKITYEVYIKNFDNRVLEISNIIPDAPLDSK
jgi:hypothetical protein